MAAYRNTRKQRKVRASVLRRTVVGSLVVMLSPFLTVLEHEEAGASFQAQNVIIHDSTPAVEGHLLDFAPFSGDSLSLLVEIESSLRREAQSYWAYENVNPEG